MKKFKNPSSSTSSAKSFSIFLSVIFLGLIVAAFMMDYITKNLVLVYLSASIVTFITYAVDKSKARRDVWRTPENMLHFLSLIGGWPGAAIAQQTLRHKSQKRSFRMVFWLIVMANCGGLAWLTSAHGAHLLNLFKSF